jgi:hypothetical protein
MTKLLMPKFSQVIVMSNKNDERDDDPKLSNLKNMVISSTILAKIGHI